MRFYVLSAQTLALLERTSLRKIRAMQVNHQEVDTVLHDRVKHIEENMRRLQLEISSKSDEWTKVCSCRGRVGARGYFSPELSFLSYGTLSEDDEQKERAHAIEQLHAVSRIPL